MTRGRRLLLCASDLARLRQRTAAHLPPGFDVSGTVEGPLTELLADPAVAADLGVLSRPDLAVLLRASRPGLAVTACLAVSGSRGAGLLRTDDSCVQLSAFPAADLGVELASAIPAHVSGRARSSEVVPLDLLLAPSGGGRREATSGTLRAVVVGAGESALGGSLDAVWDGSGWTALEPLPSRNGRPMVRLDPVSPVDLVRRIAPLLAAAA